ncbi:MAG: 16S rRNA (guanine(527)-N(7))-methyltransferase RsmG [Bacillota bacterium]|nr:16S rRNA (guanine(527)-N(7))-methyltransferase RsmG [Bacillota bacterium]
MSEFSRALTGALSQLNISPQGDELEKCQGYCQMLLKTNETMNLTAITDPEEVAIKHFADSLSLIKHVSIREGASIIDIGTGAGFPGVVLSIFRPDLKVMLLDSLAKRCKFLVNLCHELGLTNAQVINARAEDAAKDAELREQLDYATARAVASLPVLLEYALPFLSPGGEFLAMKGHREEFDLTRALQELGGEELEVIPYNLVVSGEDRHIYKFKKTSPTPDKYPRRNGKVSKKPLIG